MNRVSGEDYAAILEVLHSISSRGITQEDFGAAVVEELLTLIRADVITLNEVDPVMARVAYLSAPTSFVISAGSEEVFASLTHEHPLIRHHAATGDGSAIKISDFLTADEWHSLEIYRQFFAVVGVEHQMSITLPAPAPIVLGIAVNRSDRDFDERDRGVLNLLRPHLAQEWRRARDRSRVAALADAASAVFGQSAVGALLIDRGVHELTDGALVSLYRYFGRPGRTDPLPARVRAWLEGEIEWGIAAARDARTSPGGRLGLSRTLRANLGERALVLRYVPRAAKAASIILLTELGPDRPSDLLGRVGLTARETEIVQLLGSGATNAALAEQLGVSPWTIKRHLSSIYAKLGVSSRASVVAIAAEFEAHYRD